MSKHQQSGMRGVYLVAAEIAARGLIVSPTSRSAVGADLLVTDQNCANAYSVQVKTNAKPSRYWLVGQKAQSISSRSHVYVLVNITADDKPNEYYIVPSTFLARNVTVFERPNSTWYAVDRGSIGKFQSKWALVGAVDDA